MIHLRTEGECLPNGISFYRWGRRKLYFGFRIRIGHHQWYAFWLPTLGKFDYGHARYP